MNIGAWQPRISIQAAIWLIFATESIADLTKRPLFTINSGDVIGKGNAEEALTSILRLATSWNAVVLLDEADVFMQRRILATPTANELIAGTSSYPDEHTSLRANSL